jgi:hypothetical protein
MDSARTSHRTHRRTIGRTYRQASAHDSYARLVHLRSRTSCTSSIDIERTGRGPTSCVSCNSAGAVTTVYRTAVVQLYCNTLYCTQLRFIRYYARVYTVYSGAAELCSRLGSCSLCSCTVSCTVEYTRPITVPYGTRIRYLYTRRRTVACTGTRAYFQDIPYSQSYGRIRSAISQKKQDILNTLERTGRRPSSAA